MVEAAQNDPAMDPDRASFTAAAATAQATLIRAAGIDHQDDPAPPDAITTAILAHPLPERRARISARRVKSPM